MVGPARLIDTPALVHFWQTHRTEIGYVYDLPAGRSTIKRARQRLKFNLPEDRRKLWKKRATDLKTLPTNDFAERYSVSKNVATDWRYHMFGRSTRPDDWWQHPQALALLLNKDLKLREIAQTLKIGISHAYRLRARAAQLNPALLKKIETPIPAPLFDRKFPLLCPHALLQKSQARRILRWPRGILASVSQTHSQSCHSKNSQTPPRT